MDKTYALNDYQASIFNLEMKYPGTGICNIGGTLTYHIPVNFDVLSSAINIFIQSTPAIRLRLNREDRLYISDFYARKISIYDYSDKSQEEIDLFISKWISEPFELYDHDLFEYCFLILPGDKHGGCMKMHHILGDITALFLQFNKIANFYEQLLKGEIPDVSEDMRYINTMLPPPENDLLKNRAKTYFSGIGDYLSSLSSQNLDNGTAKRITYKLPEFTYRMVRDFCIQNQLAPIHVFYAALSTYLSGISNSKKIAIGSVQMNRLKRQMDVFGMYANTLPLMVQVQSSESFSELCRRISIDLLKLMRFCPHTTLAQIAKENRISGSLFDISVSYLTEGFLPEVQNSILKEYHNGHSDVPIRFYVQEMKDGIHYEVQYLCSIYTKEYIDSLISHIFSIMEQGALNLPVGEIDLLTEEDTRAYALLNDTTDINAFPTICELFEKIAVENPDKIALVDKKLSFTYSQVLKMSNQIAHLLEQRNLPQGSIAAIMTGRCAYLPIAMLGVMKAGYAFLPVDPWAPENVRNASIRECSVLLTLSAYGGDGIFLDRIILKNITPIDRSKSCNAAYRMKTSGSTGAAKTVEISHLSLSVRLQWMHNRYGLNRCILQKTVCTFDVSLWELLSIAFGATLIILPDGEEKLPDKIADWINRYGVEAVHFVPSMLNAFLAYTKANNITYPSLVHVFCSGERLEASTVRDFYNCVNASLHNLYGPTECTIDVTYYDCTGQESDIPIGRPVSNTGIYIVNNENKVLPIGVRGEILVTGDLVGRGYVDGAPTASGYTSFQGSHAYKTGDVGYVGFDGQIYYLGRNDNQVKIRGVRIDLAEIESNALKIDGVKQAKCIVSGKKLLLYYTAAEPIPDIRQALSQNIPANRMPSAIIYLDNMPLLSSGKIDKTALRKLPVPPEDYIPPKTDLEVLLCNEIVRQLQSEGVKIDKIGIDENIFDAGVDSLSIVSLVLNLNKAGIPVSFQDFYQSPTVRELATKKFAPKPMEYLRHDGDGSVVLCFPYAGGHPQCFSLFAEGIPHRDVVGVNYDYFDQNASVEDISKYFVNLVGDYETIQIVGCCIGSAFALETAYQLEALGKKVESITLIAALPQKPPKIFGRVINPWRLLPDSLLNTVLSRLSGKRVVLSGKFMDQFKIDTQRFFSYMNSKKKGELQVPVRLVFADKDRFTKGYKRKYKQWSRYTGGSLQMVECQSDSHFFVEEISLNL